MIAATNCTDGSALHREAAGTGVPLFLLSALVRANPLAAASPASPRMSFRTPTPHGTVQAGDDRGQGAVPGGQDHPVTAPGEPRTEQVGPPRPDQRSLAPVPLRPHAGFGQPGPVDAVAPGAERLLALGNGPAHCALRAQKADPAQSFEHDIGSDLGGRALHPFFDLGQVGVDGPLPADRLAGGGQLAGVTSCHPVGDGVVGHTGKLGGAPQALCEVISLEVFA